MSFRTALIVLNIVALGLLGVYLLWRVLSVRRNPTPKDPENLTPFLADEQLEGPRLERALGWSLLFVLVVALSLPLYFLFEPDRQSRADEAFDERAAERGAVFYANEQMETYDATRSLLCADCHGPNGEGGTAPFVLQPELDKCLKPENQSNAAVPECLPQRVGWAAPALDTVLLRYPEEEVFDILTWGRPGTPMPAWGVDSGKGVLNSQAIDDIVAYLKSIQITPAKAKARSAKEVSNYKEAATENLETQQKALTQAETDLAAARNAGASAAAIRELAAKVDTQTKVVAQARAWETQVRAMSEGEILFRLNCARCHTKGASYFDPNSLTLPAPAPQGSGAFGPNLTSGGVLEQFPGEAGRQQQFDWVALGAPRNEGYGVRGISSGRMPYFVNMLTEAQIKAIVEYERNL